MAATSAPPLPHQPGVALDLTIRFSTALPDLALPHISRPETTSGLSLLPEIRRHLPAPQARCKILLIAAGRILPLKEDLEATLRLKGASGPRKDFALESGRHVVDPAEDQGKGKGRAVGVVWEVGDVLDEQGRNLDGEDQDGEHDEVLGVAPERIVVRQIIHATFSSPSSNSEDTGLSDDDLAAEGAEGRAVNAALRERQRQQQRKQAQPSTLLPGAPLLPSSSSSLPLSTQPPQQHSQPRLQPLGFNRLLATGIPESEITLLRTHFRAVLAAEDPSAPPPTPLDLLALEERWLDDITNTTNNNGSSGTDMSLLLSSASAEPSHAEPSHAAYISDVLMGNVLGFFWPLGAVFVLSRQDGLWREARTLAVVVGMLANFAFCLARAVLLSSA